MADSPLRPSILLIEDSTTYGELATILLLESGYSVLLARTAEAGLHLAREKQPDLILIDINLPGMDGLAAARRLRQDPRTSGIPTVALTADRVAEGDQLARARDAGFKAYFTKPVDQETFRAMVESALAPSDSSSTDTEE